MDRARWFVAALLLLGGCLRPEAESTTPAVDDDPGGETEVVTRDRPELTREGSFALGEYLFELDEDGGENATPTRRAAQLERVTGNELELVIDGARRRVSRRATGPMLCLRGPLRFGEGALQISLERGAPVYVAASDATQARVGPVPIATFARVLERSALSAECGDEGSSSAGASAFVGAGEQACLFADAEPLDESDGLPIAAGAPVAILERGEEWTRVRVSTRGGALEGWMPDALVAERAPGAPDWSAAALRPERCAFPGRPTATSTQAWIERSDETVPMPDPSIFDRTLRDADPRVRGCWDELPADQRPSEPVRVELRIGVDGDGQVDLVAVVRTENAPSVLSRCIAERVRRVRFPAPRTGVTLRRTYAFDPPRPEPSDLEDEADDEL